MTPETDSRVFPGLSWLSVTEGGSEKWGGCSIRIVVSSRYSYSSSHTMKEPMGYVKEEPSMSETKGWLGKILFRSFKYIFFQNGNSFTDFSNYNDNTCWLWK